MTKEFSELSDGEKKEFKDLVNQYKANVCRKIYDGGVPGINSLVAEVFEQNEKDFFNPGFWASQEGQIKFFCIKQSFSEAIDPKNVPQNLTTDEMTKLIRENYEKRFKGLRKVFKLDK